MLSVFALSFLRRAGRICELTKNCSYLGCFMIEFPDGWISLFSLLLFGILLFNVQFLEEKSEKATLLLVVPAANKNA